MEWKVEWKMEWNSESTQTWLTRVTGTVPCMEAMLTTDKEGYYYGRARTED